MKLMDTYTNMCFLTLVVYEIHNLPVYVVFISIIFGAIVIVLKLVLTLILGIFILKRLRPSLRSTKSDTDKTELLHNTTN